MREEWIEAIGIGSRTSFFMPPTEGPHVNALKMQNTH